MNLENFIQKNYPIKRKGVWVGNVSAFSLDNEMAPQETAKMIKKGNYFIAGGVLSQAKKLIALESNMSKALILEQQVSVELEKKEGK